MLNAGVASEITAATGEGWMRLCEQVHTGKLDLGKVTDAWSDYAPTVLSVLAKMALPRARRP